MLIEFGGCTMEINFLRQGYKNSEEFYRAFLQDDLHSFGDKYIDKNNGTTILDAPDFPIYLAKGSKEKKQELFLLLIDAISRSFRDLDREYLLDELFWHSYLCIYKREYLLEAYPVIKEDQKNFENIVTKDFDWENYIYKAILAYQYISEHVQQSDVARYYNLIFENMDVFNYIIKYEIFRNSTFLVHFLEIIDETNTSKILKAKIKDRPDLGKDERYGRRVVYEFNKSYPIVLSPMLTKDQLRIYFDEFLSYYYKTGDVVEEETDDF